MEVKIVTFPETKVAVIEHYGPPETEYDTLRKLIAWKLSNKLLDQSKYRHYGLHYSDHRIAPPSDYHVEFCISFDHVVSNNPFGITSKVIPELRCAYAQDIGSRSNNKAAVYVYESWLPQSGEIKGDFPIIFHYVNVGPNVREEDMITDVYLPLK